MFRDLKEYQEIAKIYAEKVSKPAEAKSDELVENQENRNKLKQSRTIQNQGRVEKQFGFLKPKPRNLKDGQTSVRQSGVNDPRRKKETPIPTTAEIRAKDDASGGSGMSNIPSKEGNAVIDGKKLNPDFGKKVDIKKEFPDKKEIKVSKFTKQGKERTKAQMMAAKRIASGKTIQDVKDANTDAMKKRAAERNQKFQDAKKSGNLSQFRKDNPKLSGADKAKLMAKERLAKKAEMSEQKKVKPAPVPAPDMKYIMSHGMSDQTYANTANKVFSGKSETGKDGYSDQNKFTAELLRRQANTGKDFSGNPLYKKKAEKADVKSSYEYDAYDLVLEYLLSTEQAATIEEANYVMTEMDAETIQGIVEAQKKTS